MNVSDEGKREKVKEETLQCSAKGYKLAKF